MIRGMTGFGTGSFSYRGKKYAVSIRSVNHKFLDFVISLPDGLLSLESKIKKELSKCLRRGRVTFQLVSLEAYSREPVLNKELLDEYSKLIKSISRYLKIKQDIGLRDIIDLPEVIYFKKSTDYSNKNFISLFNKTIYKVLNSLIALRKKEGWAICQDLLKRTQSIDKKLKLIKKRLASIINAQKTKLDSDGLKEFLKNYNVEEEIVRLEFHVKTFRKTIKQNGSLGKILDFITQEMQREINTLSAKFRDSQVSYHSVFIKAIEISKQQELDLVEVASQAQPPVCRIMDFAKFKYEQEKKERQAKKHQTFIKLKEIRVKPKIAEHDYQVKLKHVHSFLDKGNKVKVNLFFRGREMAHQELGRRVIDRFIQDSREKGVIEKPPGREGRVLSMVIAPHK
ncbi:translation initiation factor IF-3 [Candidatus Omnitrophota bacterium]